MDLYNWAAMPWEKLSDLISRKVVHTERMTIARLRLAKGTFVPVHQHENEQVSMMEEGALKFNVGGEEVTVRAGESLRIPPNVPHSAEAIEDSVATDLFTPCREDWKRGDDAYLRK